MASRTVKLAIAALLVAAGLPVASQLARTDAPPLGAEARIHVSMEAENRRALAGGSLPVWNPYEFGGRPHFANPQTRVLYPPHVVLRALPLGLFFPASFGFHAWLAAVGAYLVWRQLNASRAAAFAGGVAIMLGTVVAPAPDRVYSPDVYGLAWVPLVVALALKSVRTPRRLPHWALVACVAAALLAGSFRGAAYVIGATLAVYLFSALRSVTRAPERDAVLVQLAWVLCLATGLSAFQLLPAARLWTSAAQVGGLTYDAPAPQSWHPVDAKSIRFDGATAALGPVRPGRLVTACERAFDTTGLLALGIPTAGGAGGIVPSDYARFVNAMGGFYPEKPYLYQGLAGVGDVPTRDDLLRLMSVSHLVSCAPVDEAQWSFVRSLPSGAIYRYEHSLPRAFWTCAPLQVGRQELLSRLSRYRYDDTLTLVAARFVHIRWSAAIGDGERRRLENAFHVVRERFMGDRTWRYEVLDDSASNLAAIVTSAAVEDTAGIDRGTFSLLPEEQQVVPAEAKTEWMIGARPCQTPRAAAVLALDQPDGQLVVRVNAPQDGIVFLSETYYPERIAWVDGRRVETLKVNLAFTGVPVTAGMHRVELRYDNRPLQAGAGLSAVTLLAWAFTTWRSRDRA